MSTLQVSNLNDGTTTVATTFVTNGSARAWTNSGSTAIRDSFGISSFTDNGTGDFSHALTNSFSSDNYAIGAAGFSSSAKSCTLDNAQTSSDIRVHLYTSSGSLNDTSSTFAAFGDLA